MPHQPTLPQKAKAAIGFVRRVILMTLAGTWRRLMFRTTVIAVTGSVGKSTAKEILAEILSTQAPTVRTFGNQNDEFGIPRNLFRLRPWHRFAVIEMGIERPGQLSRMSRFVRPDIAVILKVARTHTRSFPTLDDTAAEKATILAGLKPGGTIILNGDDPRVRAIGEGRGQVVYFGRGEHCDIRAEDVSASWPERLSFTTRLNGEAHDFATRMVGPHWINSVLAALAVANVLAVPVDDCDRAIESVEPFPARMQPVALPSGAHVIRDESNGSPDTYEAFLDVIRETRAERRIVVFSDFSDEKERTSRRLRRAGKTLGELADSIVFVGESTRHGLKGAREAGIPEENRHAFHNLKDAAEFLRTELRAGDVMFIKGRTTDHLSRLVFAQFGEIGCWRTLCKRRPVCDFCSLLEPSFDLMRALTPPPAA